MSKGNQLTELRRSNAAGIHGKKATDRHNNRRKALEKEIESWREAWTKTGGNMATSDIDDFDAFEDRTYDPDLYGPSDDELDDLADLFLDGDDGLYVDFDPADPYDIEYDVP